MIEYEDYHPEDGEPYTYKREFKQVLLDKVFSEYIKSRRFIDAHINAMLKEEDIRLYLKLVLYQLRYINNSLLKYAEAEKYETNQLVIKAFIRYIFDRYEPFVTEYREVDFFKNVLNPSSESQQSIVPATITPRMLPHNELILAFKWTGHSAERNTKLYYALIEKGFISDTVSLLDFSKAFSGEPLESPLNIRWMKTVKGKLSKPLILYLFDQLMESRLLEKVSTNQDIYKKVQRIFADHEGQPLQHFGVSSAQIKKRKSDYTGPEKVINAIISALSS